VVLAVELVVDAVELELDVVEAVELVDEDVVVDEVVVSPGAVVEVVDMVELELVVVELVVVEDVVELHPKTKSSIKLNGRVVVVLILDVEL